MQRKRGEYGKGLIFTDGSNLYHGLVKLYQGMYEDFQSFRADFRCFVELIRGDGRRLIHTHYYNVPVRRQDGPEEYASQQRFLNYIRSLPHFTLHLGRLVPRDRMIECPQCGSQFVHAYRTEKGVDVYLASHMLVMAFDNQYDTAILVSGDGDFAGAVEEIIRLGKQVENADFVSPVPTFLSQRCTRKIELTAEFLEPCVTVFRGTRIS